MPPQGTLGCVDQSSKTTQDATRGIPGNHHHSTVEHCRVSGRVVLHLRTTFPTADVSRIIIVTRDIRCRLRQRFSYKHAHRSQVVNAYIL